MENESSSSQRLKSENFRGAARIRFANLDFWNTERSDGPPGRLHRSLSPAIVSRLRRVFELEGCLRLDSENYISAILDQVSLDAILSASHISAQDLLLPRDNGIPPLLDVPLSCKIQCLSGQHRIAAAKEILGENEEESWWTVSLYVSELPIPTLLHIQEAFPNAQPYSDGEIFQKICFYRQTQLFKAESKWWARLSPAKMRDLKQLLRRSDYTAELENLLHMPGFWRPLQFGALHRVLPLRSDEEMLSYLRHITDTWKRILGPVPGSAVDVTTVSNLELLAPGRSNQDRRLVQQRMESFQLFPKVIDRSKRTMLMTNLSGLDCIVPSLRTFFDNTIYLEPCCLALRRLIGPMELPTIRQCLFASYRLPIKQNVEVYEARSLPITCFSTDLFRYCGYKQLWLYAMRHLPELISSTCAQALPKKDRRKLKPLAKSTDLNAWDKFARLAHRLGFMTRGSQEALLENADQLIARDFLIHAKPRSSHSVHQVNFEEGVRQITEVLSYFPAKQTPPKEAPRWTSTQPLPLERRCGRPFEGSYHSDFPFLFLNHMYGNSSNDKGEDITTLFVRRDFVRAFWGRDQEFDVNTLQGNAGPDDSSEPAIRIMASQIKTVNNRANEHASEQSTADARPTQVLEDTIQELKAKEAMSSIELPKLKQQLAELESKLESVLSEKLPLSEKNVKLSNDLQKKDAEIEQLQRDLLQIKTIQQASNSISVQAQGRRLREYEAEIAILNGRCNEVTKEMNQLKQQHEKVIQDHAGREGNIEAEKARLQEEINKLNGRCNEVTEEKNQLKQQYEKVIQDHVGREGNIEAEKARLQEEINKFNGRCNEVTEENNQLKQQYEQVIQDHAGREGNIEAEKARLQEEINKFNGRCNEVTEENNQLKQQYEQVIQDHAGREGNIEAEKARLQEEIARLKEKCSEVMEEKSQVMQQYERLSQEHTETKNTAEAVLSKLQGDISLHQHETGRLQQQLTSSERNVLALREDLIQAKEQAADTRMVAANTFSSMTISAADAIAKSREEALEKALILLKELKTSQDDASTNDQGVLIIYHGTELDRIRVHTIRADDENLQRLAIYVTQAKVRLLSYCGSSLDPEQFAAMRAYAKEYHVVYIVTEEDLGRFKNTLEEQFNSWCGEDDLSQSAVGKRSIGKRSIGKRPMLTIEYPEQPSSSLTIWKPEQILGKRGNQKEKAAAKGTQIKRRLIKEPKSIKGRKTDNMEVEEPSLTSEDVLETAMQDLTPGSSSSQQ
ncbi:MAG: hypothetical protein M1824_001085 [Vezdaea acicularis]|nr:MAG: hypothetical protein M1824_001085 [Vezdaea acicularis]